MPLVALRDLHLAGERWPHALDRGARDRAAFGQQLFVEGTPRMRPVACLDHATALRGGQILNRRLPA